MAKKDITNLIQQLEAFENRFGVRIEAISAFESESHEEGEVIIQVHGELHAVGSTQLTSEYACDGIVIRLNVYDDQGRLIATSFELIDADGFFGFHVIDLSCSVSKNSVTCLRLFPEAV